MSPAAGSGATGARAGAALAFSVAAGIVAAGAGRLGVSVEQAVSRASEAVRKKGKKGIMQGFPICFKVTPSGVNGGRHLGRARPAGLHWLQDGHQQAPVSKLLP
jgi:hypothetical protein